LQRVNGVKIGGAAHAPSSSHTAPAAAQSRFVAQLVLHAPAAHRNVTHGSRSPFA
jgi:hypothetical protein